MKRPDFTGWLIVFVAVCVAAPFVSADVWAGKKKKSKERREELSRIRVELDETQDQLDSLRLLETELLDRLKNLDERLALDQEMIKKINTRLAKLRKRRAAARKTLNKREKDLAGRKSDFRDQLAKFYLDAYDNPPGPVGGFELVESEYENSWSGVYFSRLSELSMRRVASASDAAASAKAHLKDVTRTASQVADLQKKRTISSSITQSRKAGSERSLSRVRQDKEQTADRLLFLSESAKQMNELIARLESSERQRSARQDRPTTESSGLFIAQKGRLKPPVQGKIVTGYGWKTDKVSNLKSFSPGIEIQGKPNYNVRAVSSGVIAYIGSLRGYGDFVIVAHDDGYYTTYGGLARVKVQLSQRIPAREPLGVTGSGPMKFELREGKKSVDPIAWLDFGSLR
ncbi:MAG: murein hydrolase activator EnvC family protein [Candidatus Zixiibacteriota bacterium]